MKQRVVAVVGSPAVFRQWMDDKLDVDKPAKYTVNKTNFTLVIGATTYRLVTDEYSCKGSEFSEVISLESMMNYNEWDTRDLNRVLRAAKERVR